MIALSFWECHTCVRLLRRWAAHRQDRIVVALKHWRHAKAASAFRQWQAMVAYRLEGVEHASSHHEVVRRR
jgi:hypothetical protein